MDKMELILQAMTAVQRRRYKLYLKGWSLIEIAEKEGVSYQVVQKSIKNAEKRAKKRVKRGVFGV